MSVWDLPQWWWLVLKYATLAHLVTESNSNGTLASEGPTQHTLPVIQHLWYYKSALTCEAYFMPTSKWYLAPGRISMICAKIRSYSAGGRTSTKIPSANQENFCVLISELISFLILQTPATDDSEVRHNQKPDQFSVLYFIASFSPTFGGTACTEVWSKYYTLCKPVRNPRLLPHWECPPATLPRDSFDRGCIWNLVMRQII